MERDVLSLMYHPADDTFNPADVRGRVNDAVCIDAGSEVTHQVNI